MSLQGRRRFTARPDVREMRDAPSFFGEENVDHGLGAMTLVEEGSDEEAPALSRRGLIDALQALDFVAHHVS